MCDKSLKIHNRQWKAQMGGQGGRDYLAKPQAGKGKYQVQNFDGIHLHFLQRSM